MQLAAPDLGELFTAIKPSLPTLSSACRLLPPRDVDFGTDRYWLRFLQGLVHWIEHDALTLDNPYVRFIRGASALGAYDPVMRRQLDDGERALKRLRPRLQGFLEALRDKAARQPLVVYNPSSLTSLRAHGYWVSSDSVIEQLMTRAMHELSAQPTMTTAVPWLGNSPPPDRRSPPG